MNIDENITVYLSDEDVKTLIVEYLASGGYDASDVTFEIKERYWGNVGEYCIETFGGATCKVKRKKSATLIPPYVERTGERLPIPDYEMDDALKRAFEIRKRGDNMRDDEREFLCAVYASHTLKPRDVIDAMDINHKRAWYLLDKWTRKGWYDYGVSLDLGWLTMSGKRQARQLMDGGESDESAGSI